MVPTLSPDTLTPSREINATILREGPTANTPLFQSPTTPVGAYNDPNRNPYFRYQGLQRLANLVTTRSNVYAVWITVGYFEVSPVQEFACGSTSFTLGETVTATTAGVTKTGKIISVNSTAGTVVLNPSGSLFAVGDSISGGTSGVSGALTAVVSPPINYPDGFTLGRELGTDTGQIERHRAFYMFDRSLPVGFQRGQDLNVKNAVLVERFIE